MKFSPVTVIVICLFTNFSAATKENCLNMHVIQSVPLGYYDDDNRLVGVQAEKLSLVEKYSGICINKILMPYARIWQSIEEGSHDGGIIFRSPDRDHLVEYVSMLQPVKVGVIAQKKFQVNRYEDLYGLVIGKTRATRLNDRFDSDEKFIIVSVTNYDHAAKMLSLNRIDALAGSTMMLKFQMAKYSKADVDDEYTIFDLGSREQWLQLSKHSQNLKYTTLLRDAVSRMKKNGDIDRLNQKYYNQ